MNDSDCKEFDCSVMTGIGVYCAILLIVTISLGGLTIFITFRNKELFTKINILYFMFQ
jgi:hypothetical protein